MALALLAFLAGPPASEEGVLCKYLLAVLSSEDLALRGWAKAPDTRLLLTALLAWYSLAALSSEGLALRGSARAPDMRQLLTVLLASLMASRSGTIDTSGGGAAATPAPARLGIPGANLPITGDPARLTAQMDSIRDDVLRRATELHAEWLAATPACSLVPSSRLRGGTRSASTVDPWARYGDSRRQMGEVCLSGTPDMPTEQAWENSPTACPGMRLGARCGAVCSTPPGFGAPLFAIPTDVHRDSDTVDKAIAEHAPETMEQSSAKSLVSWVV